MDKIERILKKLNVLVVDDMEAMRCMVTGCLNDLGIRKYRVAPNGNVAWGQLQNSTADIIICDWDMPQVSGIEFLKMVRSSERHKHIPFLMLTATTDKKSVVEAVSCGVTDYLSKPFQPQELEYRIIKLLRKLKSASTNT
ncbi:response regulator [Agaribacterium sp. ZY112]|uniref:response regulator n=1 Tax=Agaribacterium sp. ZY112 TaxID=3233574 RepID=UPI0035262357